MGMKLDLLPRTLNKNQTKTHQNLHETPIFETVKTPQDMDGHR